MTLNKQALIGRTIIAAEEIYHRPILTLDDGTNLTFEPTGWDSRDVDLHAIDFPQVVADLRANPKRDINFGSAGDCIESGDEKIRIDRYDTVETRGSVYGDWCAIGRSPGLYDELDASLPSREAVTLAEQERRAAEEEAKKRSELRARLASRLLAEYEAEHGPITEETP